jgi:hypothetical protein
MEPVIEPIKESWWDKAARRQGVTPVCPKCGSEYRLRRGCADCGYHADHGQCQAIRVDGLRCQNGRVPSGRGYGTRCKMHLYAPGRSFEEWEDTLYPGN